MTATVNGISVGATVVDPVGRRCVVIDVDPNVITVRLAGSYGATVRYPPSCLTLEEEAE